MSDDPQIMAAFVEASPEMEKLEHALATALSEHMELGPLVHLAMRCLMNGAALYFLERYLV